MLKSLCFLTFLFFGLSTQAQLDTLKISEDVQLVRINDSTFVHLSWHSLEHYGRFSSNGMLIVSQNKGLLIDTPMDSEKTKQLFDFIRDSMQIKLENVIPGHFHDDCTGGLSYLHEQGLHSIANQMTDSLCRINKKENPKETFQNELSLNFHDREITCFYPGPGHAPDNIVIYLSAEKLLFGGCLVKSSHSKSLGNLSDADLKAWPQTLQNVLNEFPDTKTVIPGHGASDTQAALQHSIELLKDHESKN